MSAFQQLQKAIANDNWETASFDDPLLRRWQRAALTEKRSKAVRRRDLTSLTRQILRRETLNAATGHPIELNIGKPSEGQPWPTPAEWAACGVQVTDYLPHHFTVQAQPWQPAYAQGVDPSAEATAEQERQPPQAREVPADPAFRHWTGYSKYRSFGQRQAMRALWYAKPGATLLTVLPTGTGKSALIQVPALAATAAQKLCVVVVPTVALALDQARAMAEYLRQNGLNVPEHLAYHGGLTRQEKWRFHDRMRQDQQGVIFTSPEGLLSSLAGSLYPVAERGNLALFAVDEVHLASQWGNDFRPEFQLLAGLRRALLDACPLNTQFQTLLLTATLTTNDFEALDQLFGQPQGIEVVPAVHLRPEPAYWSAKLTDAEVRREAIIDAVRHAPKPMIVYVTKVSEARALHKALQEDGFRRVALLTGKSTSQERRWVIDGWSAGDLDVVVGTSAFGVGIDQKHVRTVLHACIPESIDRYYQEVGRGGRDGAAMLALALTTPNDWTVAKGLAERNFIGVDRGLERWRRMFTAATHAGTFMCEVDTDLRPADLLNSNDRSRQWNLNVLNLMARAGLIRLHAKPPPGFPPDLQGINPQQYTYDQKLKFQAYEREAEQHHRTQLVEILDGTHLDLETWRQRIAPLRQRSWENAKRQLDNMTELLEGKKDFAQVLQAFYTVDIGGQQVRPLAACGGCPDCRRRGRKPYRSTDPRPPVPSWSAPPAPITAHLRPHRPLVLIYQEAAERFAVLRTLVRLGVQVIYDPASTLVWSEWDTLRGDTPQALLIGSPDPLLAPPFPTVTILPPRQRGIQSRDIDSPAQSPWQILLAHADQANVEGDPLDLHSVDVRFPHELKDHHVRTR